MNANSRTAKQQHGFTIMQMVITLAIIAVVSTFGVLGIRTARAEFRLQNSARLFASYVEKARVDAIRRHAEAGQESSIETFEPGTNNYQVTMDFGSGTLETRTFQLEDGLTFDVAAKKVSFDWRGRIAEAWVFQIHSAYLDRNVPVDVSGSGDITVGSQHFPDQSIPPFETSDVDGDVDPDPGASPGPSPPGEESPEDSPEPIPADSPSPSPTATASPTPGNGNGGDNGNGNPHGTPTPTPNPTPIEDPGPNPTPTPMPQCVSTISPSSISLSQSDPTKLTGSATFTMANALGTRIISVTQAGNGNSLVLGLSLLRIDGNGSTVISVTTKQGAGNRGVFVVQVSTDPACGSTQQLSVSVSN